MTNGNIETRVSAVEGQMQQIQSTLQQMAVLQLAGQQQLNQLGDRLGTLEQAQERTQRQLDITLNIASSNARSVQAWESRIDDVEEEAAEERSEIKVRVNRIEQGIDTLNNATSELQQASRENVAQHLDFRERFDQVLDEIRDLRQSMAG